MKIVCSCKGGFLCASWINMSSLQRSLKYMKNYTRKFKISVIENSPTVSESDCGTILFSFANKQWQHRIYIKSQTAKWNLREEIAKLLVLSKIAHKTYGTFSKMLTAHSVLSKNLSGVFTTENTITGALIDETLCEHLLHWCFLSSCK